MDISKKVLITTFSIFTVLTAVLIIASHSILITSFSDLEEQGVIENVERVQNAFDFQASYLDKTAHDWAFWNETVHFVRTLDSMYVNSNLADGTLEVLDVSLMLFINESGKPVYVKSVDMKGEDAGFVSVPPEILGGVSDGSLLMQNNSDSLKGLLLLDKGPMLVVCRPIINSRQGGEPEGTLILGRYLDSSFLESIEEATCSSIRMQRVDRNMPPDFQEILPVIGEKPMVVPRTKDLVEGYVTLGGLDGEPAVMLRLDFPRELYGRGRRVLNCMYLLLLFSGLIMGIGTKNILDVLFISRLKTIDEFVENVRDEKDISKQLKMDGDDELYRLSSGINELLKGISWAEEGIKNEEHEKKVILNSLDEMVLFLSPDFKLLWANKVALEHMNLDLEEVQRLDHRELAIRSGYFFLESWILKGLIAGESISMEFTAPGDMVWLVRISPVKSEKGELIGFLETGTEITERKKYEKELSAAKFDAENANRAKSEFLANMSHELRTPLNSVIGFSDLLCEQVFGDLNEKQLKYVRNISRSGKHLLKLINDILDISKVEAGKFELEYELFSLSGTFEEIKAQLSPQLAAKNIEIELELEGGLKAIRADRRRFVQILYNLLSNAIKFSPENGLIRVKAFRKGPRVKIEVEDEGIGISKKDLEKLFRPFSQVDSSSSKEYSGAGLGLALVKKIVHLHRGYVWVKSEPGKGSVFGFSVPVEDLGKPPSIPGSCPERQPDLPETRRTCN